MSKSSRLFLLVVGVGVIAAGLIVGFSPIHSGKYDCGSAFRESSSLFRKEFTDTLIGGTGNNQCDELRAARAPYAWGILVLGVAIAGGAGLVEYREMQERNRQEMAVRAFKE